ncbi:polyprenyl synthetase family protein [Saccharopolyspora halophila]|uniref:Polyprenyl synthetase family protein n=1 Tax=Saccharopolyspora halophila TaxID=405551 RepID=A0ABN3G0S8_9PSEU
MSIVDTNAAGAEAEPSAAGRRADLDGWLNSVRDRAADHVREFVRAQCACHFRGLPDEDFLIDLLTEYGTGGKYLRSTFAYLGWLSAGEPGDTALRAAGSTELLHAFALVQDDVMDGSAIRRGRPAAHVRLADWHRGEGLSGSSERFGTSSAVLLGDLLLVWAEQLLRESGMATTALDRAWPVYDRMRSELAVGQFADLLNDARGFPELDDVLAVARRKSGNYTVRRPLELGALLAGCDVEVLEVLRRYGTLVGEAFQLRDDLIGVFGTASVTGKPGAADLWDRKATTVVVLARDLAAPVARERMSELFAAAELDVTDVEQWRELIASTDAPDRVEELIADRVAEAQHVVSSAPLDSFLGEALADMAVRCTKGEKR